MEDSIAVEVFSPVREDYLPQATSPERTDQRRKDD